MKKYANSALFYAILAMIGGVFFREFTKFFSFDGATTLAFVHTHYFALGMIMFLLLLVLEKTLHIADRSVSRAVVAYHVGLNVTASCSWLAACPRFWVSIFPAAWTRRSPASRVGPYRFGCEHCTHPAGRQTRRGPRREEMMASQGKTSGDLCPPSGIAAGGWWRR